MSRKQIERLWDDCFNILCGIVDNAVSKQYLKPILQLVNKLSDICQNEDQLLSDTKATLYWMITQLEWKHREQKGEPEYTQIELSPEMKKARELLEKL